MLILDIGWANRGAVVGSMIRPAYRMTAMTL